MATNNFKLFDENKANMMGDTEYGVNPQRLNGVQTGVASSELNNKFAYQMSLVAYSIAQMMNANGIDANDTQAVSAFVNGLSNTVMQKVLDKATDEMAIAGSDNSHYMTPSLVKKGVESVVQSGTYGNFAAQGFSLLERIDNYTTNNFKTSDNIFIPIYNNFYNLVFNEKPLINDMIIYIKKVTIKYVDFNKKSGSGISLVTYDNSRGNIINNFGQIFPVIPSSKSDNSDSIYENVKVYLSCCSSGDEPQRTLSITCSLLRSSYSILIYNDTMEGSIGIGSRSISQSSPTVFNMNFEQIEFWYK